MATAGRPGAARAAPASGLDHILAMERCPRCGGFMVLEPGAELLDGGVLLECPVRRCVACGEVVDPVILDNRRRSVSGALRAGAGAVALQPQERN